MRVDKCDTAQRFYLVFICGVASMIEIIVAYDTSLNVGLIVDGTGHALALYHLSLHKPDLFQELLKRNSNINLCQMNSSQCRNIFSHDFAKLSFFSF